MLLKYTMRIDLWIAGSVHLPTTWQSADNSYGAMTDLEHKINSSATGGLVDQWTYKATSGRKIIIDYIISCEPYTQEGVLENMWCSDRMLVKCITPGGEPAIYTFETKREPTAVQGWTPSPQAARQVAMAEKSKNEMQEVHDIFNEIATRELKAMCEGGGTATRVLAGECTRPEARYLPGVGCHLWWARD